jgi:hypothetical protein
MRVAEKLDWKGLRLRPEFNPWPIHVGFVVEKVVLAQVIVQVLQRSSVSASYQCSISLQLSVLSVSSFVKQTLV